MLKKTILSYEGDAMPVALYALCAETVFQTVFQTVFHVCKEQLEGASETNAITMEDVLAEAYPLYLRSMVRYDPERGDLDLYLGNALKRRTRIYIASMQHETGGGEEVEDTGVMAPSFDIPSIYSELVDEGKVAEETAKLYDRLARAQVLISAGSTEVIVDASAFSARTEVTGSFKSVGYVPAPASVSIAESHNVSLTVRQPDDSKAEVKCEWTIENGPPGYSLDLKRDGTSIHTASYSSTPASDTYYDSNVSNGSTYTYKILTPTKPSSPTRTTIPSPTPTTSR